MIHHLRPDEEPDVDDVPAALRRIHVAPFEEGLCGRCGHDDHESPDCPTVVPYLLKEHL